MIQAVISKKEKIPYINLDESNEYRGWVSDFRIKLPNGPLMKLDLKEENDLFLLFVLAPSSQKLGLGKMWPFLPPI